ncbi:MAG TPA: Gfo/Idh/MocA family oxidoreductase [Bryobacteraceae bacterium]|nr:Gfo/Idh/MocA family oxidoreductase [Bryobacteraceae bacterium]
MDQPELPWGILGTAQIARKNWRAIRNSGNATVAAVASRSLDRSRRFIGECQADVPMPIMPQSFGSYEELLHSKDIQAVYIPLPTGLRKEWVIRAARAGKHILCEKPCAVTTADLREMLDVCREHHVQFLDGVMFMHSGRLTRMREVLDDPASIGGIRRIQSAFTFNAPPEFYEGNIRTQPGLEPHGCMGDVGWYCIRLSLWAMQWQMPREVSARMLSENVVPTELSGELYFENGVSAGFYCSFRTNNQQWAVISGTRGYLRLDDFVLPVAGNNLDFEIQHLDYRVSGCDVRMVPDATRHSIIEPSHGEAGSQECNMFRAFSDQVRSGSLNPEWPRIALQTQLVMNACLDSARRDGKPVAILYP